MDSQLKQRLVGAAVLVALAVIFLPMLVKGPAPDSGVSDLPLTMPDAPGGDYVTRDLPLVAPGGEGAPVLRDDVLPTVDTATVPPARQALPLPDDAASAASPLPDSGPAAASTRLPATVAGGDYAVSFGAYGSSGNAQTVVTRLRAAGLPGYREAATVAGKNAWRVRIGPYATRADAEAARIAAGSVRDDLDARVIVLDAESATPAVAATKPKPSAPAPAERADVTTPATPPAAPAAAANVGFAVQVGAFSKPGDASALRDRLRASGFNAMTETVDTDKGMLTRVKAGPVLSRADADQLKAQLKAQLGLDGLVRSHP
ncbi:MAG: SPOR domain-containing protein [Luteimonas sp.]